MTNTAVKIETQPRCISLPEAARYIGVSRATMYNYMNAGIIKGFKVQGSRVWKFDRHDLDAWIDKQKRG